MILKYYYLLRNRKIIYGRFLRRNAALALLYTRKFIIRQLVADRPLKPFQRERTLII